MTLKFERSSFDKNILNLYEHKKMTLGYSEKKFNIKNLSRCFQDRQIVQLKQTHSNDIWLADKIKSGIRGDGIIITDKNRIAVIKTADCVPLFFWDCSYSVGGILHIGWRGLLKQIEKKLVEKLIQTEINLKNFYFYFGPCIEKQCYRVDWKLYNKFITIPYRDTFFFNKDTHFLMDLKMGISTSLKKKGIPEENIYDSQLCSFCNDTRFPSFRRDGKSDDRIFNFLFFK